MSNDDLVKAHRQGYAQGCSVGETLRHAMSVRIEELEANAMKASNAALLEKRRADEAQAKLAKAVEALERIASGEFSGRMLTSMPPQDAAQYFARTTLAELKRETDG